MTTKRTAPRDPRATLALLTTLSPADIARQSDIEVERLNHLALRELVEA